MEIADSVELERYVQSITKNNHNYTDPKTSIGVNIGEVGAPSELVHIQQTSFYWVESISINMQHRDSHSDNIEINNTETYLQQLLIQCTNRCNHHSRNQNKRYIKIVILKCPSLCREINKKVSVVEGPFRVPNSPVVPATASCNHSNSEYIDSLLTLDQSEEYNTSGFEYLIIYISSNKKYRAFMLEHFNVIILPLFLEFVSSSLIPSDSDTLAGNTTRNTDASSDCTSMSLDQILLVSASKDDYDLMMILSAAALLTFQPSTIPFQHSEQRNQLHIKLPQQPTSSVILSETEESIQRNKLIYSKNDVRFTLVWIQQQLVFVPFYADEQVVDGDSFHSQSVPSPLQPLPHTQPCRSMIKLLEGYFSDRSH